MRKLIRIALLAGVSLLAMTLPARAEFGLGVAISSAILSLTGVALAIDVALIGKIALGALALGAQLITSSLFSGRNTLPPSEYKSNFTASDGAELRGVGLVRVGGLKVYGNTSGYNRYRMIAHLRGPINAVIQPYLGSQPVTVEADGAVSSPPYAKPGGSWVYLRHQIGDGNEIAESSAVVNLTDWTAAHRGRGIFQTTAIYISPGLSQAKFNRLYQGGTADVSYLAQAEKVYNPVGPAIAWTRNGILNATHVLSQFPGFVSDRFDWPTIAAEAAKADQLVATKTGTEPRATCDGLYAAENKRVEVAQAFIASIGGDIREDENGRIQVVLVDDAPVAELTFPAAYVDRYTYHYGPEAVVRPNICRVRYWSPERHYEMADIDMTGIAWARIDDEVTRYGEIFHDAEFPYCTSASQAQRLARREFLLKRAHYGILTTNQAGMALWDRRFVNIEFPEMGVDGESETKLCLIGTPRVNDEEGTVEIPFTVWPTELITQPWTPAVHEAAAPEQLPDMQFESELPTPAAPVEAAVVQLLSGQYETRIKFAGVAGGTIAEANYQTITGGIPDAWASMTEYEGFGNDWYAWAATDSRPDANFRVRFFDADEEGSYFSDPLEATGLAINNTPPAAPTVAAVGVNQGGSATFTFTLSTTEIRVVALRIDIEGEITTIVARPGVNHTFIHTVFNPNGNEMTINYSVACQTSNGTIGAVVNSSVTAPAVQA